MKPGRELDLLVAEKIFGWSPSQVYDKHSYLSYSTDISAAWEVVEKVKSEYSVTIDTCLEHEGKWLCTFAYHQVEGDSAPHAICLAALKAKGVEV